MELHETSWIVYLTPQLQRTLGGGSLDDLVYWLTIKERSTVTSPGW